MSLLYFLEFFIGDINLDDQIVRDAGETEFVVWIDVIDFPTFQITRQNLSCAEVPPSIEGNRHLDFGAGQACHFTSPPQKLIQKILRHPFSIKILRQGDSIPTCLAELPLSGCLCDQAKASAEDSFVSSPYVFCGSIRLVDLGGNRAGSISISLRITCQGRYVLTSYILEDGCFVFKNSGVGAEFKVKEIGQDRYQVEGGKVSGENFLPWENLMLEVAGISPGAGRLALGKPVLKPPRAPLIPADSAPVQEKLTIKKENKGKKKGKEKK